MLFLKKKNITINEVTNFICVILLALIFLSKISFKILGIFPYSVNPLIFQYGIHPFVNFSIQLICFCILFFIWFKSTDATKLKPLFALYVSILVLVLTMQTLFQITFVNVTYSALMQISGLGMALILMIMYGVLIPALFPVEKFISVTRRLGSILVIVSLILLPFFSEIMFKGGRFVGLFKHIPHMVSASSIAFIFMLPKLFEEKKWTLKDNTLVVIAVVTLLGVAVFLTFTKAAIFSIIISLLAVILAFGSKKKSVRMFKFTFITSLIISGLLIGAPVTKYIYEITSGKAAIGSRPAQDGIQTRLEEVTRGMKYFEKSPYFGMGLLYKFMGGDNGVEVSSYNSFKDPHNLFVSAGVIGGWPLLILSIVGYIFMIIGTIKGLLSSDSSRKILAIFLLAHLPVFVIYHAHFSLGGIGDRIYWLVFGYLGQSFKTKS